MTRPILSFFLKRMRIRVKMKKIFRRSTIHHFSTFTGDEQKWLRALLKEIIINTYVAKKIQFQANNT
jgi:hypothetical protein